MSNEITISNSGIFSSIEKFEQTKFMAEFLSSSDLVPKDYQNKPANVLIAMNMASRLGSDVMQVMQNLYIIHGRPSWSSQFLIATLNSSGKFSSLQYSFFGEPNADEWGCFAYATEKESGLKVSGPKITMAMAKAEGWYGKNGSKWKTLPELMLTYRAAAFFVRTKAPELSMGMSTVEESRDMGQASVVYESEAPAKSEVVNELKALQKKQTKKVKVKEEKEPEPELEPVEDEFDIVKFVKMSIDSCTTLEDLQEIGSDIKEKVDEGELDEAQTNEVKVHLNEALKAIKNP